MRISLRSILVCLCAVGSLCGEAEVLFDWGVLDYDWDALGISRQEAIARGQDHAQAVNQTTGAFIPEYNCMAGLKAYACGDGCMEYFVTVPRWMPGVPSTLNKVVRKNDAFVLQVLLPSRLCPRVGDANALRRGSPSR
jgi:hypothetical protein